MTQDKPTYDELLQALRETQQLLQVWNYPFVKQQFYANANLLRRAQEDESDDNN